MGRKKRAGFADLHVTRASFSRDEARCPTCNRHVGASDNPKLVATFGSAEPTLATLTCERCRTMLSIRFVES
jgi:uncharacterized protein with PIN domain